MSTAAAYVLPNVQEGIETPSDFEPKMAQRIEAEQIRHIYSQTYTFVPAVFVGALLTVIMLWPAAEPLTAVAWCAWIWIVYAVFWWLCARWYKADPGDEEMKTWARPFVLLGWVATFSWGMAGILFFDPDSMIHQAILLMCLTFGAAAIMATSTAYSPTFYTVVMLLTPVAIRISFEPGLLPKVLAVGLLTFTVMLFFLHRNTQRSFTSALELRFLNEALAAQLEVQRDVADKANRAKSRFLASASHDLRQPLHALGLFLGELRERIDEPSSRQRLLNHIDQSVESMTHLFNALMDISRIEAGAIEVELRSFRVDKLLQDLQAEYSVRAQREGLRYRTVSCGAVICSDPLLLKRILRNLIENAIRYTQSGCVLVGCRRGDRAIRVQVLDTGIGIPERSLAKVFTEFYQLDNPERDRTKGLGLGLSVVKQLAGLLGHSLSVRSVPGKGTLFTLEIPLAEGSVDDDVFAPEQLPVIDKLSSACVLVIDDDLAVCESMRGLLEAWGCEVLTATGIYTAVQVMGEAGRQPDIVVSDYRLEGKTTGVEAIDTVRKALDSALPGVLITGDTTDISTQDAQASGITLMHKPVNPSRLCTLLRFLLAEAEEET